MKVTYKHNTIERHSDYEVIAVSNRTKMSYVFNVEIGDIDNAPKFCSCGSRSIATRGTCTHMEDVSKFLKQEAAEMNKRPHTAQEVVEDDWSDFDYGIPIFAS